jgi:hypothetical protein
MSDDCTYTQDAILEAGVLCGMDCCVWLADIPHMIHHAMRLYVYIHIERF